MKIRIITVGSFKNKNIIKEINKYKKWISKYQKLEIVNLKSGGNPKKIPLKKIKENEYDKIINQMGKRSYNIALDEKGNSHTSMGFSEKYRKIRIMGVKELNFLIGGPFGHSKKILNKASLILSLSKLTLTHEMSALILIEQIFRAHKIINNENYHY